MKNGNTPDKQRIISKLVNNFDKDWEINIKTFEITYKYKKGFKKILPNKSHNVFSMYWWLKYAFTNDAKLQCLNFPLIHDNMPIEGLPIKYQLQHNWSIPKKDLKYLKGGPLVDQDFNILIQYRTLFDEIGYKISIIKDIYIRFKFLIALIVIFLSIILLFGSNTYIDTIKGFLKILN